MPDSGHMLGGCNPTTASSRPVQVTGDDIHSGRVWPMPPDVPSGSGVTV
jgi:hypothetical protein